MGRSPQCAIPLSHPSVSREHARIVLQGAGAVISDLKSSNGTFVNGERVDQTALRPGDEIRLGQFTLRFAADVEIEEIRLEGDSPMASIPLPSTAPSTVSRPSVAPAPEKKKISEKPVRPTAAAQPPSALLRQDVFQYGGYYRLALLLAAAVLAVGAFLGVRYLSSKLAEKAQDAEALEESEPR